ncbi:MAG: chemotaxis protein CheA [Bacteroidales bacterium]|nr:chemotaxis protein CheA [Bacteroidales bacterium]
MDRFQAKFVEEALDNVSSIEEALFELEKDPENKEIIERLFRSMHTIKGGGAMFGFNDLSTFTHNLETIYDLIRTDKLKVDKDIISLTFESLDYIKQLLDLGELTNEEDIARQNDYIARIQKYFPEDDGTSSRPRPKLVAATAATTQAEQPKAAGAKNYLIDFTPFESLLNNGTNPLFILDDLTALGKSKTIAFCDDIKPFAKFEPLVIRIKWQVILSTEQDVNDIKDVFIFVEDECKVDILELPDGDIIGNTDKLPKMIDDAKASYKFLEQKDFEVFKTAQPAADVKKAAKADAAKAQPGGETKISSMRVSSAKIDELVNAVSELVTMQAQLNLFAVKSNDPALQALAEQMEKITRQLRENSFEISLIPLQGELVRFQRLVRDLCNKLNKQMEFVVEGGDIELDKNIIEHLTDPLLHIIRNSGDHGIEMPEERIKKGKNPKGTILLKAYYSGSSVIIKISDDGKGMDPEKILKKAIEKGLVDSGANMTKNEILNLVFASGFSTAEKVSDVSGRGVGMDVVKSKIAEIRGEVSIDSIVDQGTVITLELPLTLSIIDGLLTKVKDEQFVVPLSNIEKIVSPQDVVFNSNGTGSLFTYRDEQIMYIDICDMFYSQKSDMDKSKILLVKQGEKHVGLVVNQIVGEYQIVVKPLGRFLRKLDMIPGASVMGDGSLSLIIDTTRLINFYNQKRYKNQK